ncbi:hypothetical protein GLYMA_14G058551v4 [Glycine max]|nr:hypothetical protein GLYMA_14G058551v4 [Glycine max]KAH1093250.1 hypothetical protein GYH30_039135 [Glycine max]
MLHLFIGLILKLEKCHLFFTLAFNQEFRVCVSYSRDRGPTLSCRN